VSYSSIFEEMRRDEVHGASWYFDKALNAAEAALGRISEEQFINELMGIRRGMASLAFVADALHRFGMGAETIRALRMYGEEARHALSRIHREGSVLTISYSSAVSLVFGSSIRYVLESRPGSEAEELVKRFPGIAMVPDSAMAQFAAEVDMIAVGTDGIYMDKALNKVGTLPLALVARHLGKPFIVVGESFKAQPHNADCSGLHEVEFRGIPVKLFDCVPTQLIDLFITDVGEFQPGGAAMNIYEAAMRRVSDYLDSPH